MATEVVSPNTTTYVVEIGKEVILVNVEEDSDSEIITVTKAGKTGYIVGVDISHDKVTVGDWPEGEEWVVVKQYSTT